MGNAGSLQLSKTRSWLLLGCGGGVTQPPPSYQLLTLYLLDSS